jgi:hypothetical protein
MEPRDTVLIPSPTPKLYCRGDCFLPARHAIPAIELIYAGFGVRWLNTADWPQCA